MTWESKRIVNPHDFKFCPKCGHRLRVREHDGVPRLICEHCGFIFYQNPVPAVGAILVEDGKVVLVRRKFEPKAGDWSLPAGFIEFGETLKEALVREVKEETNLDIEVGELFGAYSAMDDPRTHVILVLYRGKIIGGELRPGDDAEEAGFFPLNALPPNIAFSCHAYALEQVRRELEGGGPSAKA